MAEKNKKELPKTTKVVTKITDHKVKKQSKAYSVPSELQHAYKMAVQRANRRIKSNLKYIREKGIDSPHTIRSLVGGFDDGLNWASRTMPFSRSNKGRYVTNPDTGFQEFREFKTKTEFEQYLRYLNKWGQETKKGERYSAHPEQIKADYTSAIIKSLNQIKDHYNISLPNGQIPKEVIADIKSMNVQEITNFFGNGDPAEDIEISQFSSDDFLNVETAEDFTDVIRARISAIKKFN